MNTYQGSIPSDTYLESLLGKPHFITLVALHKGGVVGRLVAYELEKFEQERREIYIYDLAISETHRRKGIATNLLQYMKQIAKGRGAYVMFVQADKGDTPAVRLYESFGKREDVHQFDIPND